MGFEENDGENKYIYIYAKYNAYIINVYVFFEIYENILLQSHPAACISTSGTVVHDIHEKIKEQMYIYIYVIKNIYINLISMCTGKVSESMFLYIENSWMKGYIQYISCSYTTESRMLLTFELNSLQIKNGKRVVPSNSLSVYMKVV